MPEEQRTQKSTDILILEKLQELNRNIEFINDRLDVIAHIRKEQEAESPPAELTQKPSDPHPHLTVAHKYEGKDEDNDNVELEAFLGVNPADVPWCAAFVDKCLKEAGFDAIGTLRARDFALYGEEGDGSVGDIAVWRNHVAFVSETEDEIKVIGGNQSDKVNVSPKRWYDRYSEFISYRRPA